MAEPASRRPVVAVSLKTYLGYQETLRWLRAVAEFTARYSDKTDIVVLPVAPALAEAVAAGTRAGFSVGAQDVSDQPPGAYTGELPAQLVAELGATYVEIGHAERRFVFGETDALIARKLAASVRQGLTPLICVGEGQLGNTTAVDPLSALQSSGTQLSAALALLPRTTALVVAYEPVWAIGADQPAPVVHIRLVTEGLRRMLTDYPAARVIYGGTAGPGLFGRLSASIDGLFLGRRAHDPAAFGRVLAEVAAER